MDFPVATWSAIEANVSAVVESCSDAVSATDVIDIEADRFGATVLVVSGLPAAIDPGSLLGSSFVGDDEHGTPIEVVGVERRRRDHGSGSVLADRHAPVVQRTTGSPLPDPHAYWRDVRRLTERDAADRFLLRHDAALTLRDALVVYGTCSASMLITDTDAGQSQVARRRLPVGRSTTWRELVPGVRVNAPGPTGIMYPCPRSPAA